MYSSNELSRLVNKGDLVKFEAALTQYPELLSHSFSDDDGDIAESSVVLLSLKYAQLEMLSLLLERGAKLAEQPTDTLLYFLKTGMYRNGGKPRAAIIALLIKYGATFPNEKTACRQLLACLYKAYRQDDLKPLQDLTDAGLDWAATERCAQSAMLSRYLDKVWQDTHLVSDYLLDVGCTIEGFADEIAPLNSALQHKRYHEVERLLAQGAVLQTDLGLNEWLEHYCRDEDFPEILLKQLSQQLDFKQRLSKGNSLIHLLLEQTVRHSHEHARQIQLMDYFLKQGTELEALNEAGETALSLAVSENNAQAIAHLIKRGADVSKVRMRSCALLEVNEIRQLVREGDLIAFEQFLNQYPELPTTVFGRGYWKNTAVLVCIEYGQVQMLALLLERGASIPAQPRAVIPYLLENTRHLRKKAVTKKLLSLLLAHGASFPALSDSRACQHFIQQSLSDCYGDDNISLFKTLVDLGFDPVATEQAAQSSMLYHSLSHSYKKNKRIFHYLLDLGCAVDGYVSSYSSAPLRYAFKNEHYACTEALLDKGADRQYLGKKFLHDVGCFYLENLPLPLLERLTQGLDFNARDGDKNTPLHHASMCNAAEIMTFFIQQGADINAQGEKGRTPLLMAIHHNSKDAIRALLSAGADVNINEDNGKTPLDVALSLAGFKRVCTSLKKLGAKSQLDLTDEAVTPEKMRSILRTDIEAGEPWAKAAQHSLLSLALEKQVIWHDLLRHCLDNNSSKPSARWLKQAGLLLDKIGTDYFRSCLLSWLPLLKDKRSRNPRGDVSEQYYYGDQSFFISENNTRVLKGLLWLAGRFDDNDMSRTLRQVASVMFKKVYGIGMRNAKIANAAVYSLSQMPGTTGLKEIIVLRTATKYNPALVHINRVFTQLAKARDVSVEELETLAVPDYGLSDIGRYQSQLGEFTALLSLIGVGKTQLLWQKGEKLQKTVPAALKKTEAEAIKVLKGMAKDIQVGSRAHAQRLEQFYLRKQTLTLAEWQEQYINHYLLGFLARRLIWRLDSGKQQQDVFYLDGDYLDKQGQAVSLPKNAKVSLWHPSLSPAAEVKYWREWLIENQITQPFKQAYREVYFLTDAERQTHDHSLRFANHILKHQQFHALAVQRGWQQTVGGSWDGGQENAAYKSIPAFKVGVNFEAEGLDQYDYTDSGIYSCVGTSDVRFYRQHKALALDKLDPLLFSEVMRDVDLFVGVASIGNDPNWQERGYSRDGNGDYWQNSSFGDLSEIAKTRKAVLEALIPKLKIAKQLRLEERFLIVEGKVRTYKIHLGSSNILMEPNDSYLCIVETRARATNVMLPFEGDSILSLILSKAMLLANDSRIKDATILSQINAQ